MPDDLSPAELRRVRKAIRAAHAKGVELGRAEGRREAATLLEYAARLNGSTPHAVAVLKAEDAAGHEHGEHGRFAPKGGGGPGGKADRHPDGTSRRENPHPRARAAYRAVRDYLAENGSASGEELAEVVKDAGVPPAKAAAVVDGLYNRGLVTEGEGDSLQLHAHAGKAAPALAAVKEYLADYGEADPAELVEHLKDGGLSRGAAARALQDLHHSGELVKEGGKFKLPPAEAKALGLPAGGPGSTNTERAPDPAGDDPLAALADAMLAHAEESLAAGDDPAPGLERLRGLADDPAALAEVLAAGGADAETVGKCWLVLKAGKYDESKHPRDDRGRYVSRDKIQAAASDPAKRKELEASVTDPEQRKKLHAAISDQDGTTGRTKRGQAAHEAARRRTTREEGKAKTAALLSHLKRVGDLKAKLTADHLHDLADHLQSGHPTVEDVRAMRKALAGAGQGLASFGGARKKDAMVAALVAHAKGKAFDARVKEQGFDPEEMRDALAPAPEAAPAKPEPPAVEPTLQELETGVRPGGGRRAQHADPMSRPYRREEGASVAEKGPLDEVFPSSRKDAKRLADLARTDSDAARRYVEEEIPPGPNSREIEDAYNIADLRNMDAADLHALATNTRRPDRPVEPKSPPPPAPAAVPPPRRGAADPAPEPPADNWDDRVYGIDEVAQKIGVTTQRARELFDSGKLRGYRIPGEDAPRIPHAMVEKYLRENPDLAPQPARPAGADALAGHPLAGATPEERRAKLRQEVGRVVTGGERDTRGYDRDGPPPPEAMDAARRAIAEAAAKGNGGEPTLKDAFAAMPPGTPLHEFQRAVYHLARRGDVGLTNWSKTPDEVPDPEHTIPLGAKHHYWVRPTPQSPAPRPAGADDARPTAGEFAAASTPAAKVGAPASPPPAPAKPHRAVSVEQFRDGISGLRDAIAGVSAAVGGRERASALAVVARAADELAGAASPGANQKDVERANAMLDQATAHGWSGGRVADAARQPWQMTPDEFIAERHPQIEQMRRSEGTGGRDLPRRVVDAMREHKELVQAAVERGDPVPPETLRRHGITTESGPFQSDPKWDPERFAMSLDKGHGFWKDGRPVRWAAAKDAGSADKAAEFLKQNGEDEVSVQFQHHGDDRLKKRYADRVKAIAEQAGYEAGEPTTRVEQGHTFDGHAVITLRKKPAAATPAPATPQPARPAGADDARPTADEFAGASAPAAKVTPAPAKPARAAKPKAPPARPAWVAADPAASAALDAHAAAPGRAKDVIGNALANAGVLGTDRDGNPTGPAAEPPESDSGRTPAQELAGALAAGHRDQHDLGHSDDEREAVASLLRDLGAVQVGEVGGSARFDGAVHDGPPGAFTGHAVTVTRPGWKIPLGGGRWWVPVKARTGRPGAAKNPPTNVATALDTPTAVGNTTPVPATPAGAPTGGGKMDNRHVVVGDTFKHKGAIREAGGAWDAARKEWTVPAGAELPAGLATRPVAEVRAEDDERAIAADPARGSEAVGREVLRPHPQRAGALTPSVLLRTQTVPVSQKDGTTVPAHVELHSTGSGSHREHEVRVYFRHPKSGEINRLSSVGGAVSGGYNPTHERAAELYAAEMEKADAVFAAAVAKLGGGVVA